MNTAHIIESIHKEYVHVQNERVQIHQLNLEITEESEALYNSTWVVRNQRYLCDKLNINGIEYLELFDELNKRDGIVFTKGHQRFGSNEVFLSQLLQYLNGNPKSVSYLLFHAEKTYSGFLDPLCKIILSSVYSHCHFDGDRNAIVDLIEELLEIYLNFYSNVRRQIHSKYSSLCMLYRNFSDQLPELKTFFKLALHQPIMHVLSEDTFYLDRDHERAAMRFTPNGRERHFGLENSPEYHVNLAKYKGWTLKKMQTFIQHFINSLKGAIFSFPQSLAALIIRIYTKLIEHLDFKEVYAICIDLIFCFLICPAIQNPDLFGIIDLHVNTVSHYNLLQCAQTIQMLALSKWDKANDSFKEICDLFDKECLSFVIDHILGIFNCASLPRSIDLSAMPYFLISEFELRLLLEYIKLFLSQSDQSDNPLGNYFFKLPESVVNFQIRKKDQSPIAQKSKSLEALISGIGNSTSASSGSCDNSDFDACQIISSKNEDFVCNYQLLFFSRTVFQITNENFCFPKIGLLTEKEFLTKIEQKPIQLIDDIDSLIGDIEHFCVEKVIKSESDPKSIKNLDDGVLIDDHKQSEDGLSSSFFDISNDMDYLNLFDNRQHGVSFKDFFLQTPQSDMSLFQLNIKSFSNVGYKENLKTAHKDLIEPKSCTNTANIIDVVDSPSNELIKLNLGSHDLIDPLDAADATLDLKNESKSIQSEPLVILSPAQTIDSAKSESPIQRNSLNKKSFFSLTNLKNIKDKVKNISLKDNKLHPSTVENFNFDNLHANQIIRNISKEKFDIEKVKQKTEQILQKYRKNSEAEKDKEMLILIDESDGTNKKTSVIEINDEIDHSIHVAGNQFETIKAKLRKLLCLIDVSSTYRNYRFLNLKNKTNFILLLKILLSQAQNMNEITNSVLIIDMIRVIEELTDDDLSSVLAEIQNDLKIRHFYSIYLWKSRQHLTFRLRCIKSLQLTRHREQFITNFIIVSFLIRHLIEKKEEDIEDLSNQISDPTMPVDEKVPIVSDFVTDILQSDECMCLTDEQHSLALHVTERHLFGQIYMSVFYVNGDIDRLRDQVLQKQVETLSKTLDPSSKLLNIPAKYCFAAPWLSAQAELLSLSAYKTPRDKVQCIHRCCSHILTLLSTTDNTIPSADDLLPVLIFVTIKANPMSILSTIQYVNSFHSHELVGEEAYYWTQFCSVVEFIKTILN